MINNIALQPLREKITPFGRSEVDTMINQAKEVLEWDDNMQNPFSTWYKDYIK